MAERGAEFSSNSVHDEYEDLAEEFRMLRRTES
jgi:hypothetical protein